MCRTPRWHYHPIVLDIRSGEVIEGLSSLFAETDAARADQLEATVYILLASIVRDFLVVEDRSAVFGRVKEDRHRSVQNRGTSTEPVVVYLPRVRYAAPGSEPVRDPRVLDSPPRRFQGRVHKI